MAHGTSEVLPTETSHPVFPSDSDSEFVEVEHPYACYDMNTIDEPSGSVPIAPLRASEFSVSIVNIIACKES